MVMDFKTLDCQQVLSVVSKPPMIIGPLKILNQLCEPYQQQIVHLDQIQKKRRDVINTIPRNVKSLCTGRLERDELTPHLKRVKRQNLISPLLVRNRRSDYVPPKTLCEHENLNHCFSYLDTAKNLKAFPQEYWDNSDLYADYSYYRPAIMNTLLVIYDKNVEKWGSSRKNYIFFEDYFKYFFECVNLNCLSAIREESDDLRHDVKVELDHIKPVLQEHGKSIEKNANDTLENLKSFLRLNEQFTIQNLKNFMKKLVRKWTM